MKVLAINGSARPNGNTAILIRTIFAELEKQGIETELVQLAGSQLRGCAACYGCFRTKNNKCVISEDILNECVAKMMAADGIILASPTYFADVSAEMKALIDRADARFGAMRLGTVRFVQPPAIQRIGQRIMARQGIHLIETFA